MSLTARCHCGRTVLKINGEFPEKLTRCTCSLSLLMGPSVDSSPAAISSWMEASRLPIGTESWHQAVTRP
jgi:hypothetical protein